MIKKNYKIVTSENKAIHTIKEVFTDQNIQSFSDFSTARKFMKRLNSGGGFNGNTPPFFFLVPMKMHTDKI